MSRLGGLALVLWAVLLGCGAEDDACRLDAVEHDALLAYVLDQPEGIWRLLSSDEGTGYNLRILHYGDRLFVWPSSYSEKFASRADQIAIVEGLSSWPVEYTLHDCCYYTKDPTSWVDGVDEYLHERHLTGRVSEEEGFSSSARLEALERRRETGERFLSDLPEPCAYFLLTETIEAARNDRISEKVRARVDRDTVSFLAKEVSGIVDLADVRKITVEPYGAKLQTFVRGEFLYDFVDEDEGAGQVWRYFSVKLDLRGEGRVVWAWIEWRGKGEPSDTAVDLTDHLEAIVFAQ